MTSPINITKLRNEVEVRQNRKYKTYEAVLDNCFQKILLCNKSNNDCICTYSIPPITFGLPLYDLNDCCKYVVDKLIEKGFDVFLQAPSTLHISWVPKPKAPPPEYIPRSNNGNGYGNSNHNSNKNVYNTSGDGQKNKYNNKPTPDSIYENNPYQNNPYGTGYVERENPYERYFVDYKGKNKQKQQDSANNYGETVNNYGETAINMDKPREKKKPVKQEKQTKHYKPIDDYIETSGNTYNIEDLNLFSNKLDTLFDN